MSNLFSFEWFTLRKSRFTYVLMALAVLVAFVQFFTPRDVVSYPALFQEQVMFMAITILLPCFAGLHIATGFSQGTMKNSVASGNSRLRIYLTKLWVHGLGGIIFLYGIPMLISVALAFLVGHPIAFNLYTLQILGLSALFIFAFASINAFFAFWFADNGIVSVFLIVLGFTPLMLNEYPGLLGELVTNYLPHILSMNILNVANFTSADWMRMIAVPLVTILIFGSLGAWLFGRKEIK